MPTPVFSILADGKDVSGNFSGLNVTMTITDGEGLKADTLQIVIDDRDGRVAAPRTGAVLQAIGGYQGLPLRDFGLFSVDSVSFEGWPQKVTVGAKSVAATSLAKQREPKAYSKTEYPTYGDIFKEVAGSIGLSLQISAEIASTANPYEARSEEDGLEFVTRIGEKLNAAVSVKAGNLIVVVKGAGQSASGAPLAYLTVAKGKNLLSYSVTLKDEPKYSEVEATTYDRKKNERKAVTESTGMTGPKFLIRQPYQEEAEAQRAAKSKAKDLVRAQADGNFDIEGDPFAMAESYAQVSGCRLGVDGLWRVKTVTHNFSSSAAYTCSLQCETPSGD